MTHNWKPIEYKFILLGDSTVGKSSIYSRLAGNKFKNITMQTLGTEKVTIYFDKVEINKAENIQKNFQILLFDTAGQERYRSITKSYFRDSEGIILIYDITKAQTFEHIQLWLESIKESLSDWKRSRYIVMLLGNKYDIVENNMEKRAVLIEEAQRLCSEQGIYWGGECSAKTFDDDEIREIFEKFIKQIYLKLGDDNYENNKNKQLSKKLSNKKKKKNNCCKNKLVD
jgi:small GTP-binding protein